MLRAQMSLPFATLTHLHDHNTLLHALWHQYSRNSRHSLLLIRAANQDLDALASLDILEGLFRLSEADFA